MLDTVAWHGLGSRAPEGLDQGLTAAAPAAGDRVASALRAPHHSGSFELASLPWFSCQLGPLQPGRTPAHPAIPCFGLQQEIGHGRSRSPLPQLGSGPRLRPRGLHPTERTAPALRGCLLVGRLWWYGFGLRRSKRVHPLELLLAGPLRSRKALMWSDQRAEGGASRRCCRFKRRNREGPQPERRRRGREIGFEFFRKGAPGQLKSLGTDAFAASWTWG